MKNINIKNVLIKPSDNTTYTTLDIMGKKFANINLAPNVYAVETLDIIDIILNEDIQFENGKTGWHSI